ncbi:MAG: SIS domain-containing protein [Anaerovoracaceae bacterium]
MAVEIKVVLLDIDGVVTNGKVLVNSAGEEIKQIDFKDLDGAFEIKRMGLKLGFLTKEQTAITEFFKRRFEPDFFYNGISDKLCAIDAICEELNITRENVCYMGDGKYDVQGVANVGLGVCPNNAIPEVKEVASLVLEKDGGDGCVWQLVEHLKSLAERNNFTNSLLEHIDVVNRIKLDKQLQEKIVAVADKIVDCYKNGGRVLFAGNGGSASDAQHLATELVSRFYFNRPPLDAESLASNVATLTALANDYAYDNVFARQVLAKAKKGDVFVGISTSGKSQNILEAFRAAKEKQAVVVAMIGRNITKDVEDFADYIINVPSDITPRIQECHILIGHMICEIVERKVFGAI